MRARVQPVAMGMIPARDYGRKYNLTPGQVDYRIRQGKVHATKYGSFWHVADDEPVDLICGQIRDGKKRCGCCRQWKSLNDFSPSRRQSGSGMCRDCNAHMQRKLKPTKAGFISTVSLSYERELAAFEEIERAGRGGNYERRRRVTAHAKRIKAMGLQGDGEGWADGEGS